MTRTYIKKADKKKAQEIAAANTKPVSSYFAKPKTETETTCSPIGVTSPIAVSCPCHASAPVSSTTPTPTDPAAQEEDSTGTSAMQIRGFYGTYKAKLHAADQARKQKELQDAFDAASHGLRHSVEATQQSGSEPESRAEHAPPASASNASASASTACTSSASGPVAKTAPRSKRTRTPKAAAAAAKKPKRTAVDTTATSDSRNQTRKQKRDDFEACFSGRVQSSKRRRACGIVERLQAAGYNVRR